MDDTIDFSFLKLHTDIYRTRQLMLGTAVASRLLTSPALASLVQSETAVAQRQDVDRFYQALKGKLPFSGIEASPNAEIKVVAGASEVAAPTFAVMATTESLHAEVTFGGASAGSQLTLALAAEDNGPTLSGTSIGHVGLETALQKNFERARIEGKREQITEAEPVMSGANYDFRTASIAKRLDSPPASETRLYAVANRYEAVSAIDSVGQGEAGAGAKGSFGLNLDDVLVYGVATGSFDSEGHPVRKAQTFRELRASGFDAVLNDPGPRNPLDESVHLFESVRVLEYNIATLRAVEARIASYRQLLADCRGVLAALSADVARANARLRVLDDQVDDARHRVGTALALLADEQQRVQIVNRRRQNVLAQHLRVWAYVRPRAVEAIVEAPAVLLDPGLLPPAAPACLAAHDAPPPELENMLQLVREAPIAFFRYLPKVLEKLDRVELLHGTIATAQLRAQARLAVPKGAPGGLLTFSTRATTSILGKQIGRAIDAQHARIAERRLVVSQLDLSKFIGLGWRESRDQALEVLTLGDLIESNHGRRVVAESAQAELDRIGRIGACLYARVGDVLPVIRLAWAELLGQHDEGVPLGNLSALPRFSELPFAQRKALQELADWLYDRIERAQPDALSLMHDFVRVCILLASHAPVDEIIAGHLAADAQASPGGSVPVAIDPLRVKLGMRALFYRGTELVAHGVIDDLLGVQARARVLETKESAALSLPKDTKVRFIAADSALLPAAFLKGR
jgi:hypothetical protein